MPDSQHPFGMPGTCTLTTETGAAYPGCEPYEYYSEYCDAISN